MDVDHMFRLICRLKFIMWISQCIGCLLLVRKYGSVLSLGSIQEEVPDSLVVLHIYTPADALSLCSS